jgi:hypothetical protein
MEWKDLVLDGYGRIPQELEEILKNVTKADLDWQPHPDCNSLGWTVWHLARVQDAQIAALMGWEQVYISGKWYTKFKRRADPKDTGFGDTAREVAAFKSPAKSVLLEYTRAVTEQSRRYITSLEPADLKRVLDEPWFQPLPTAAVRIVSILADGHQHTGEASYIRGLRAAMKAK